MSWRQKAGHATSRQWTYALENGSAVVDTVRAAGRRALKLASDPFSSAVIERVQQVCRPKDCDARLSASTKEKPVIVEDGIIALGLATRGAWSDSDGTMCRPSVCSFVPRPGLDRALPCWIWMMKAADAQP
jgi:hypothetical protein